MISITGQTNITDLKIGRETLNGLGNEIRKFVVTTMEIHWKFSKERLGGNPEKVIMIDTMDESWLDKMLESLPHFETLVDIGGGQAIDAAKYISWRKGIRLITVPSI